MRLFVLILVPVCAAGAGCADGGYYWHNPAKTRAQAKRDCLRCRNLAVAEASQAVAEYYYGHSATARGPNGSGHGIDPSDADCSALRGWTEWGATYQENVFRGCMKHKGYRLTSVAGR
ncbi:MAG: hypothetical protein JSW66_16350 [Phycisphaerales bacterium]|nr:MAG: hypothetical protein JSW66_16350 [Phycisphaerales bacterium]